jgi:hypothetical protein
MAFCCCTKIAPSAGLNSLHILIGCTQDDNLRRRCTYRRWQPCAAMCSFKRAMVMATLSAKTRSSSRVSCRRRSKLRMRSRASWNSLSSLACSGQQIAQVEGEHIKHLLKTSRSNVAVRRTKGKHYFRLLFAIGSYRPQRCGMPHFPRFLPSD